MLERLRVEPGRAARLAERDTADRLGFDKESATERMRAIPALFAQMRGNLDPARVPKIHAETVAKQNAGLLALVDQFITPNAGQLSGDEPGVHGHGHRRTRPRRRALQPSEHHRAAHRRALHHLDWIG